MLAELINVRCSNDQNTYQTRIGDPEAALDPCNNL